MAALLTQDMGNQDKTIKVIAECREMGIKILPPNLNESRADFAVVEGGIRFGLAAVKNVGIKAVESIIDERNQDGPFKDLFNFCKRIDGAKVNRRVLEGLIQCGAFDFTGINRARLFASLDDVIRFCGAGQDPNQLNMFASLSGNDAGAGALFDIPDMGEWNEREKLRREKEALGFYITGHPLDRFKPEVKGIATCLIEGLTDLSDKSPVKVAGVIENLKLKRTRRGQKMATLTLEDQTGSTTVVLFPDIFNNYSPLLKSDEPLLVSGTAEVDDNNSGKIIAQKIISLETVKQKAIKFIELRLNEEIISRGLLEDIKNIFFKYPGECSILFRVYIKQGKEIIITAHDHYKVSPSDEMRGEIESLIGQKVICAYGKKNSYNSKSEYP